VRGRFTPKKFLKTPKISQRNDQNTTNWSFNPSPQEEGSIQEGFDPNIFLNLDYTDQEDIDEPEAGQIPEHQNLLQNNHSWNTSLFQEVQTDPGNFTTDSCIDPALFEIDLVSTDFHGSTPLPELPTSNLIITTLAAAELSTGSSSSPQHSSGKHLSRIAPRPNHQLQSSSESYQSSSDEQAHSPLSSTGTDNLTAATDNLVDPRASEGVYDAQETGESSRRKKRRRREMIKKHVCPEVSCGFKESSKRRLRKHCKEVHEILGHRCENCNSVIGRDDNFKKHVRGCVVGGSKKPRKTMSPRGTFVQF